MRKFIELKPDVWNEVSGVFAIVMILAADKDVPLRILGKSRNSCILC